MAEQQTEDFLGEFRLGHGLSTSQIAAKGLAILVGVIFTMAGPVLSLTGSVAPLAFVLAGIVFGLTLLNALELVGGSGERGGSYTLVQETPGGAVGFLTGWSLIAGSLAISAALARTAADHLTLLTPQIDASATPIIALALTATLLLAQLLQIFSRRRLTRPLVTLFIAGLIAVILLDLPAVDLSMYRTTERGGFGDLVQAVALLAASYVAFEAILMSRTRVPDPEQRAFRATIATLAGSTGLFAIVALVAVGLAPSKPTTLRQALPAAAAAQAGQDTATALAEILGRNGILPAGLSIAFGFGAITLALNGCLNVTARQMHAMSRHGALPAILRRVRRLFGPPAPLFAAIALALFPLIVWGDPRVLINLTALAFLATMTALDAAAIYSHQTEPDRRRPFVLPFFPLVPALAIAINVALAWALPLRSWLWLGGWLLIGVIVYLAYAKGKQVEAQAGVFVFGRQVSEEEREARYRILVPLSPQEDRQLLLRLAAALAQQTDGEVTPLQVISIPDPLSVSVEEGRRLAQERNTLFSWSTRLGADVGVPVRPITRLARSVPEGIIDTAIEEQCNLILLAWGETTEARGASLGRILDPVVRNAPCDVSVVAYQRTNATSSDAVQTEPQPARVTEQPATPEAEPRSAGTLTAEPLQRVTRILVPTAGGPHAPLAIRLALLLASQYDATITALYVVGTDATAEDIEAGRERIRETVAAMREEAEALISRNGHEPTLESIVIDPRIVKADDVVAGIADAAADHDLVLVGASEESIVDQVLFGNVPERIARACTAPVLMVKRYRGLPRLWAQQTWDTVYGALPTLSLSEQIEVYKEVRRGARPDVDFFVMMGLSAAIATFGLLLNSTAVMIGAMLVAPLMTPILALSLGIIMGDARLLRLAVESTLKGVALAIGLAVVMVAISPLQTVTAEIAARIRPNLFDLGVALASGAAGAYAIARKDVAAALPGVAIAAALVPPLGVIGIGLAMGNPGIAGGGTLLFTTNLVAITFAGAFVLLLLGFRPTHAEEGEVHLRRGLSTTLVLLFIIAIPLAAVFVQSVRDTRMHRAIDRTLDRQIAAVPDVSLVKFEFEEKDTEVRITATVYIQREMRPAVAQSIKEALDQAIGKPVRLRFVAIPISELEAPPR